MKKRKILKALIIILPLILIIAGICFFQFSPTGYRMSIPYRHSFTEIDDNIYVNRDYLSCKDELNALVSEAKKRDTDFWGEMKSNPVIILCNDEKLISQLGGDHDTSTLLFPVKQSYISISDEYFNIDILAHEMTHAELHYRLSADVLGNIPTWFDEGIATQNDYREQYDLSTWNEKTDNGKNTVALEDMDEPSEFYAGTTDDRRFRYLNAKHEVNEWLKINNQQGLLDLIDSLNNGTDFYTAYEE